MAAKHNDASPYWRLLRYARPYWLHILGFLLVSLIATPLTLLTPLPLAIAVDSVIGAEPLPGFMDPITPGFVTSSGTSLLVTVALMYVAISFLTQSQAIGQALLGTYVGEKLVLGFRARLFRHLQRLSLAYHDAQGTSDSLYRVQYDATAIQSIALGGVIPFITAGFTLASMIYIIMLLDWQLGLVALAISPVLFMIASTYRRRLRKRSREVKQLESSAMSVVHEVLGAMRVVKAFAQEEREQERFVSRSSASLGARIRLALSEGSFSLLVGLSLAAGTATVLYVGTLHVQSGTLTLGELLLVMSYIAMLYQPLKTSAKRVGKLQSALVSAERAFAVLDQPGDVPEAANAVPLSRARGAVKLENVSFGYAQDYPVIRNASLDIPPGVRVGIVGPTGAGKTTLISLLTRFYDPDSGRILLDGLDLREYKLADLRNQFGIVLQEPMLFSTTIAENIAYGRPAASFEEIRQAAGMASAHEFIQLLPDGYDTMVGERGMRLSGGERQRVSLARAFLKDAPVLILDEPTSSVDMTTEALIIEALHRLMENRTTFIIAHRLSTLQRCDLWVKVEDGRIALTEPTRSEEVGAAVAGQSMGGAAHV